MIENNKNDMFIRIMDIILIMIIVRPNEIKAITESKKWMLVYGRRKTGKSFLVENFAKYDDYFFVKKDKSIIDKKNNNTLNYDTLIEILRRNIHDNKTTVIDEFHRLGQEFLEFLHASKKSGRIILLSSTLYLAKKLFSANSSILGIFKELPINLISITDTITNLKNKYSKKELFELSIILKEPITIDYLQENKSPRELFAEIITGSIKTIPALIGEIFLEEERSISGIYEGILRAIANGNVTSSKIADYLYSRKLITKNDPSLTQQYLNNLVSFGVLKKIYVFNKNKFVYKHTSPLVRLFYYADEKYNISERTINNEEILRIIDELMPKLVEDNARELLAEKYSLTELIYETKDYDVNILLSKFKTPQIAGEVKWKTTIDKNDIKNAEENLNKFDVKERILFVPDKDKIKVNTKLKIIDISDIIP